MSDELVVAADQFPSVRTDRDTHLSDRARERITDGVAPETRRAYTRQWAAFETWCTSEGRTALPATSETLAEYVTVLADNGKSPSTIEQAMAAVRTNHRIAGYAGQPDTNAARLVLRAYRKERRRPTKEAAPATIDPLRAMVATCDTSVRDQRDHLVLVLGFALYGRRSELAALELRDLTETDDGLTVLIRASKTDKDAQGETVAIPYGQHAATCPVRVTRTWRATLAEHGITEGRLLRSVTRHGRIGESFADRHVDTIVKARAWAAGLPNAEEFSAHSLRAGGASSSYEGGAAPSTIAKHGRWAPGSPVMWKYIRVVDQWRDNALRGSGM